MILIDNHDSFTYNIVQYLQELGVHPQVFKNDEITVKKLKTLSFESIILSPGPKTPDEAGICLETIKEFHETKKILGICLGHQCIAQFFGATIEKDPNPCHGKTSKIYFDEKSMIYKKVKQGFEATRYHSLKVNPTTMPDRLIVNAKTQDEIIMGIEHKEYKIYGVQFHPEAILTEYGHQILENFISL